MRNEAIQQTDGTWAVYITGGCKAHHLTLSQVSEQFEGLKFTILPARESWVLGSNKEQLVVSMVKSGESY